MLHCIASSCAGIVKTTAYPFGDAGDVFTYNLRFANTSASGFLCRRQMSVVNAIVKAVVRLLNVRATPSLFNQRCEWRPPFKGIEGGEFKLRFSVQVKMALPSR